VTALLSFGFSVAGIISLFAAGAVWIIIRPRSRLAPRALLVLALAYLAISTFGVSFQVERLLTRGYRPLAAADVPKGRIAIVVLGSGSFTTRNWDRVAYTTVDLAASERVLEAARVYRFTGAQWVISSGGSPNPNDRNQPSGLAMRKALIDLGVPPSAILVETESRNTHDESLIVGDMLKKVGAEHAILVTSARHMRRSVGTFRAAGVEVIPAIARNWLLDRPRSDRWLPSADGLWEARDVTHEEFGLTAYFGRGWYSFH
jgi:uncharacterized SAM-binding protein YcdF (DUF218 family)